MNKKIMSICTILLFSTFTIFPTKVSADMDMMNPTMNMSNDFSMDMIMQQGQISMEGSTDMMQQAEDTNFMNHNSDDTLTFFFDNLDQYNNLDEMNLIENINDNIQDAFQNGEWSNLFNDHFNTDSGMLFPEVNFMDSINVESPQGGSDDSDITSNSNMPLSVDNNNSSTDFPNETELPNHSDVVDQINNNTLPDTTPDNPLENNEPLENNADLNFSKDDELDNSINNENDIPETSNDISSEKS